MKKFVRIVVLVSVGMNNPFFHYQNKEGIETGQIVRVPFGRRFLLGVVIGFDEECKYKTKNILDILPVSIPKFLLEVLLEYSDYYFTLPISFLKAALPKFIREDKWTEIDEKWLRLLDNEFKPRGGKQKLVIEKLNLENYKMRSLVDEEEVSVAVLKNLEKKGVIEIFSKEIESPEFKEPEFSKLNEEQEQALTIIEKARHPVLLHGITGSGKTELYLRLVADMILQKKASLILVPEIALTPQLVGRFEEYFSGMIAVLHSHKSDGERASSWREIASGLKKVVIGSRSAIFAPACDLGLIILDEYHDDSYKQDAQPLYDTRKLAEALATKSNAKLVLGSATPRVEDYYFSS